MKDDVHYKNLLNELHLKLLDLESKLNKLSLIKFCREKAEKYLAEVTESLYNINFVLSGMLSKKVENNNEPFLNEIKL